MRDGWEYKKLGEVCIIERGGSPRPISNYITDSEEGINWIKIGDAVEGSKYISSTKEKIKPEGKKKSRFVCKGDFILSNSMSFGKPYILNIDGCIHDGWLVIHDKEEVFSKDFLYYLLSSPVMFAKFSQLAVGGVVNNLNSSIVRKVNVAIPPKSMQLDIVSELDQINDLIRLKKEQLKEYDNLAQSIFYDMFGDPVEDEKGWDVKKLGELVELKNGLNFTPAEDGTKIRIIGVADFKDNSAITDIDAIGFKTIKEEVSQDYYLKDGDILIVRSNGSKELVGRNLIVCTNGELVTYSGFCIRCRIKDLSMLSSLYLNAFLSKREIRVLLRHEGRGANISNINQKVLSSQRVPLPPLPLQQEFSSRIEQIEKLKAEVQKTITDLETLLASRMQYWFE